MLSDDMYPRELSVKEFEWIRWLLPPDRIGYERMMQRIKPLFVLGEGRWGAGDFVLGAIGQTIDRTEGMRPVFAFGVVRGEPCDVTIALHEPNDEGSIEFNIATSINIPPPENFVEHARWTYSSWSPGQPCPATGGDVRAVALPSQGNRALRLVISPNQRVVWLHDPAEGTNILVPVTNLYNELVIVKRLRDPMIALNHTLLFSNPEMFSDSDIARAFVKYNVLYRKVAVATFDAPEKPQSFWTRLFRRDAPR